MKRLLTVSALALSVLAVSQQSASAWCNFKFGVGLNLEVQSGNNSTLWGAFRNGQVPTPDGYGYGPSVYVPQPMSPDFHAPLPTPVHSSVLPQYYSPAPSAPALATQQPSAPATTPANYIYPASYYPSYPANYYPMSYGYYGNYGYGYGSYNFGQ